MNRAALLLRLLTAAACLALCAQTASAVDRTWLPAAGVWDFPLNWSGDVAPTSTDIAHIDNNGTASLPAGSTGSASAFFIGKTAYGKLDITGGTMTGIAAKLGDTLTSYGEANLSGPTSVWDLESFLVVGNYGNADVSISGGAMLCNYDYGWIAAQNGTVASITVSGENSLWESSWISAGLRGVGTLTIEEGAEAICYYADIGLFPGANGTMIVDGATSTFTNTGEMYVGVDGAATLRLVDGGKANISGQTTVGALGKIEGNGNFNGDVSNGGVVAPGASAGLLNVGGDYAQTGGGKLKMELGGALAGEFDRLLVTGSIAFGGTLEVGLIDEFAPALGDEFNLIDFASHSGAFTTLDLPALGGGLTWNKSQLYSDGVLRVSLLGDYDDDNDVDAEDIDILSDIIFRGGSDPGGDDTGDLNGTAGTTQDDMDYLVNTVLETVYGDADLDGDVDGADLDAWRIRDSLGDPIGWATGDWDGDNDVDGADFDHWRLRLPAIGGAAVAVPEPTALWLFSIGMPPLIVGTVRRIALSSKRRTDA